MQKRGLVLLFLLILPVVVAEFPASTEEAVAALAKPSVARVHADFVYHVSGEPPMPGTLEPTDTVEFDVPGSASGSGFLVSHNGYVVTNAHVVLPLPEGEELNDVIPAVRERWQLPDTPAVNAYLQEHVRVLRSRTERVVVRLPQQVFGGVAGKMFDAEVKRVGEPHPGLDLAVLKMDVRNYPVLELGSSTHLDAGSRVVVLGFPIAGELTGEEFDATVTAGIVSSKKRTEQGREIVQMDAAVETGSSGGPVLDSSGKVVGVEVLSYAHKQGFNYFIPVEQVKEFLTDSLILPETGVTHKIYERALAQFWSENYERSIEEFRAVLDLYPDHPYAPSYIARARIAVEQQEGIDYNILFFSIGVFLVLLVIVLFFIVVRERHEIEVLQHK